MKKISAAIVDTYPNKKFAEIATRMVCNLPFINIIHTLSDHPILEGEAINFIEIPQIKNNNQYGSIILNKLDEIIKDEHVLIFQWDGLPLNPNNFRENFLDYDYIGAPDDHGWVGNGGLSLRSKKLLETLRKLNIDVDLKNPYDQPEDKIICTHNRKLLEQQGIKFAPAMVAREFSFESGYINKKAFGFHGVFNFPFFIHEAEILKYSDDIIARIGQPVSLITFLNNLKRENMLNVLQKILKDFHEKPNVLNAFYYLQANDPMSPSLQLFKEFGTP